MPNWQSSQYIGEPLQRDEVFELFKNAIDSQALTDDVKLTYLKLLSKGKTKSGIAEFANWGVRYRKALKQLNENMARHRQLPVHT